MARANFMPGIRTKEAAEAALDGFPARSYITWQSDSPIFLHGVMLTYSNTIDRKQRTHMQLARSDLGVWMPESRSEHGVFRSVEQLLATRKYIDLKFEMPGSLATAPPVPAPMLRNTVRWLCSTRHRAIVTAVSAVLVMLCAFALFRLVNGTEVEAVMGNAALGARSAILTDVRSAVDRFQQHLRPVLDGMHAAMEAQISEDGDQVVSGISAPSRDIEIACLAAVATTHDAIASAAARHAKAFPWREAATAVGGLSMVCLLMSVASSWLMCCGRPGHGFEADKGLQMGLTAFDGLGSRTEQSSPPWEEEASSSASSRGRAGRSRSSSESRRRRPSPRLPGQPNPNPVGGRAGAPRLGMLWMLTLAAALVQAIASGYFAVRVSFAAGFAGSSVADLLTPLRPAWLMPRSVQQSQGGLGEEDERAELLGSKGVSALAATVFGGDIPPRCAAVLEESQAAWRGAVIDVARAPLSEVAWRAPWALVSWVPGAEAVAQVMMPVLEQLPAIEQGSTCWWAVWPLGVLVDSRWSNPTALAQESYFGSLRLLVGELQAEAADDKSQARAAASIVDKCRVPQALERYTCSDWVLQSQDGVPTSTVVVLGVIVFVFLGIQAGRGTIIDAAGLGLRYRLNDLGLGLGLDAAGGRDLTIDMDEDASLATKRD